MIEREKKFKVGEKLFIARFPNVGQLIDLESLKQALTSNKYGAMAASGVASMYDALDLVDTIAFFQVVVPQVTKHLDIENFAALTLDQTAHLVEIYKKELKPWFDGVMNELKKSSVNDGESKES